MNNEYVFYCDANGVSEFPLTEQQKFMIIQDEKALENTGKKDGNTNLGNAFRISLPLSHKRLESSIQRVLDENDALTMILMKKENTYFQKVVKNYKFKLDIIEAEGIDADERFEYAVKNATEFIGQDIDYYKEISIKFRLIKLDKSDYVFIYVVNHWIGDGMSFNLMIEQIFKYYMDLNAPREECASFIDFIKYENDFVASETGKKQLDYWKDELKEYKKINLELAGKGVSASAEDQFMQFETKKLNKIARKFKTSQFNVMLFVYHIILSDLLKTNDTIVGFSCANRLNKEFYKTIGYLSRAVQHRMIINDTDKLSDLLEISKVKCNENLANQQTSHYNDNSQFYISFQNFISKKKQEESILVPIKIPVKRVLDFFTMIVFEKSDELTLMLNGDEDIFSSDFINSLKKYLYVVVDMLYENPEASVANVRNAYQETCK